jgi:predicted RNA binding protein YcfA (HicA-like mRNA interferase family)
VKMPRDLSGAELARALSRWGYEVTRQTGSHLRLTRRRGDETHHVTIPAHKPLKVGTLSSILRTVSRHLGMDRDELLRELLK